MFSFVCQQRRVFLVRSLFALPPTGPSGRYFCLIHSCGGQSMKGSNLVFGAQVLLPSHIACLPLGRRCRFAMVAFWGAPCGIFLIIILPTLPIPSSASSSLIFLHLLTCEECVLVLDVRQSIWEKSNCCQFAAGACVGSGVGGGAVVGAAVGASGSSAVPERGLQTDDTAAMCYLPAPAYTAAGIAADADTRAAVFMQARMRLLMLLALY